MVSFLVQELDSGINSLVFINENFDTTDYRLQLKVGCIPEDHQT